MRRLDDRWSGHIFDSPPESRAWWTLRAWCLVSLGLFALAWRLDDFLPAAWACITAFFAGYWKGRLEEAALQHSGRGVELTGGAE